MEWIKVSERLPDGNMRVLVTKSHDTEMCVYRNVEILDYDAERELFVGWDYRTDKAIVCDEVIAWMPLPETYWEE